MRMAWGILSMLVFAAAAGAQQPAAAPEELQQRLAAVQKSMSRSQAALKRYSWTESVEVSVKGKVKNVQQKECRYGADGKLVETPMAATGGNKLDNDLRDYLEPGRQPDSALCSTGAACDAGRGRCGKGKRKQRIRNSDVYRLREARRPRGTLL